MMRKCDNAYDLEPVATSVADGRWTAAVAKLFIGECNNRIAVLSRLTRRTRVVARPAEYVTHTVHSAPGLA